MGPHGFIWGEVHLSIGSGLTGGIVAMDEDMRIELNDWGKRLYDARQAFHHRPENTNTIHFEDPNPADLTTIPPLHYVGSSELLKYQAFLNRLQSHLNGLDIQGEELKRVEAALRAEIEGELLILRGAISRAWQARKAQLTTPWPANVTIIQKGMVIFALATTLSESI